MISFAADYFKNKRHIGLKTLFAGKRKVEEAMLLPLNTIFYRGTMPTGLIAFVLPAFQEPL